METLKEILTNYTNTIKNNRVSYVTEMHNMQKVFDALQRKYRLVGEGNFRRVYDLGRYILKIDSDPKKHQKKFLTQEEIRSLQCLGETYSPKLIGYDRANKHWAIVEKVTPFTNNAGQDDEIERRLIKLLNLDEKELKKVQNNYVSVLKYYFHYFHYLNKDEVRIRFQKSPWYRGFILGLRKCNVNTIDFKPVNLGYRGTDDILLIDAGYPGFEGKTMFKEPEWNTL